MNLTEAIQTAVRTNHARWVEQICDRLREKGFRYPDIVAVFESRGVSQPELEEQLLEADRLASFE